MAGFSIFDATGTLQTVNLLPPLGQNGREASLPIALATDVGLPPQAAVAPIVSPALEGSRILKSSSGNLLSLSVVIGATSGYLMLFDVTTVPADGPVAPHWQQFIKSDGTAGSFSKSWAPGPPLFFASGIVAVFSSTGPFTKTASATAYFSAQIA
jgi:hypothetical protein